MFTDGQIWCQTINYSLLACYSWKQNWKITSETDFMAFLVKALFRWNECSKNADISVLSNFLAIFFRILFSISRNFTKYYLHAKFQVNWTIQTEITEGESALARPYQSAKNPACLGLRPIYTIRLQGPRFVALKIGRRHSDGPIWSFCFSRRLSPLKKSLERK